MNKIFLFSQRLVCPSMVQCCPCVDSEDVHDPNQALLDLIFGINPATGLPEGDLSVYLGDKANPEIRNFIESQLLKERSDVHGLSGLSTEVTNKFRDLSDDDVAFFSRNHGESRQEYADRLRLYFAEERERRARSKKQAKIDKLLNGEKD